MTLEFLTLPDRRLAYQRSRGSADKPGVVFLGGYASDMTGTKASFLAERCDAANYSYLRFDYRGHGQSSGEFKNCVLGEWFDDACSLFERMTEGPQIVIGSSMGGWIGLLLAMKIPERLKAFIGIAAAPDFTEDLMWAQLTSEQRAKLEREGFIYDESAPPDQRPPVTLKLIEEARKHLLLRGSLNIRCPSHLLQGMRDEEVPWGHALRILQSTTFDNMKVTLIKDGDHRLSRPQDLELLWQTVESAF